MMLEKNSDEIIKFVGDWMRRNATPVTNATR
jgi:hypothetical protein